MADAAKLKALGLATKLAQEIATQIEQTAAKAAADAAKALDTKISAADGKAAAAQNSVKTATEDLKKLGNRVTAAEGKKVKWSDIDAATIPKTFPPIIGDKATEAMAGNWRPKWADIPDHPNPPTLETVTPDTLEDPGDTDVALTGEGFTQ